MAVKEGSSQIITALNANIQQMTAGTTGNGPYQKEDEIINQFDEIHSYGF